MRTINLCDFSGDDDRERIAAALIEAKMIPGSRLVIEPGVYHITTERSREIREHVMSGDYGECPEPVMFSPDFPYDRGIDLSGHRGTVIDAVGAKLMIDGFMEDISIRDCSDVTVRGFEIDNTVKPYTKAVVVSVDGKSANVRLEKNIALETPVVRTAIYSNKYSRFIPEICDVEKLSSVIGPDGVILLKGAFSEVEPGDEIYLCHTFHFRPSVLIENAKNIKVEDVTVHSHAGMGLTAFHGENITLDKFRVVPSDKEHFSTNTDATHFTSCSGYLKILNCEFEGQGDDGINVHTYYYTPVENDRNKVKLKIASPTWTHTQKMDSPCVNDTLELTDLMTLDPVEKYRVEAAAADESERVCTVTLDRDLPEDMSNYLLADPDRVPCVEVRNTSFKNHFARGMTLKARRILIDNCVMTDLFELPIKLAAEWYWHEGVNCDSMTVTNCRFINCGKLKYCVPKFECGGIEVFMDTRAHAASHGNVTIENNEIECPDCDHAIMLRDLKSAHLENNKLISSKEPLVVAENVDLI